MFSSAISFGSVLLAKLKILNISTGSSFLNVFSYLLPHFLQVTELTNVSFNMFNVLVFLSLLYSSQKTQQIFSIQKLT